MKRLVFLFAGAAYLFSCTSDSGNATGNISKGDSTSLQDSAKLFVLSTPLQVATFLKTHAQHAHPEFLSDKSIPTSYYFTDYQRALNLGVCIADIGYAALYENRQLALDYISRAEDLVRALKLTAVATPYMERIRNNLEQKDSLSYLLLTLFNESQVHLNSNKREKTAFYMMSGSFLENLAITVQHEKLQTSRPFIQLIAQEKMWLDNLAEALTYLEPDDESQDLYNTLYTLQDCYKDFDVQIVSNQPYCAFTPDAFAKLEAKSIQLRDEVIGKK